MRGITPVITTVLLLLMAVAAVGGAWVWYQRMQTSSTAGGSGQVEQLKKTAVTVSVDKLSCSGGLFQMIMSNTGTESTTLNNVTVVNAGGTVLGYNDSWTIPADSLDTDAAMKNSTNGGSGTSCGTGTTYYISARIGAQYVIRDYPVTAK